MKDYVEDVIKDEIVALLSREGKLEKMDDKWAEFVKSSAIWVELAHYERFGEPVPIALTHEGPGDWGALWVGEDVWWVLETDPQWYMERIAEALTHEGYDVMIEFSGYSCDWRDINEFAAEVRRRCGCVVFPITSITSTDPDRPGWVNVQYRVAGRCRPEAWHEIKALAKERGLFLFGIGKVEVRG